MLDSQVFAALNTAVTQMLRRAMKPIEVFAVQEVLRPIQGEPKTIEIKFRIPELRLLQPEAIK